MATEFNPYLLSDAATIEPPTSWMGRLRYCGPGFILSASIVGSGELIMTTTLGAEVGFSALWVIIASCFVKVAVQLAWGRHTIESGQTCVGALNALPGARIGRMHWTLWIWLLLQPVKFVQMGGIIGAVAIVTHIAFPSLSIAASCWLHAAVVALLVAVGRYRFVERVSLSLLAAFTITTLASVVALQWTPCAIEWRDVAMGFEGRLPSHGAFLLVLGAFGLTGVGGDEILHYSYWLLEKGYAAHVGPYRKDDDAWRKRANGWIRVMYLDAILSMIAYTVVTAAFFLLGASVLHDRGDVPKGEALIDSLATMYTETLGPWSEGVFLTGAFVVLFSSLFAALAAWCRMFADVFGVLGWVQFESPHSRRRTIVVLACVFPAVWAAAYLIGMKEPVGMVVLGGLATSAILLIVVLSAIYFLFRPAATGIQSGWFYRFAFWVSAACILALAAYGIVKVIAENA